MMQLRRSEERGGANHGWLKTAHTFSFADYYDPEQMGFSALRVINEDYVESGAGFPMHAHRDMEIITVVLKGALQHRDTMGNESVIRPGEVQRMSAGTGVRHSEFNGSRDEEVHLYQIWIMPDQAGHQPSYDQKSFAAQLAKEDWVLAVSPDGRDGSMRMNQNAFLWLGNVQAGKNLARKLDPKRKYWVQVMEGTAKVEGQSVKAGDGLSLVSLESLEVTSEKGAKILFFDLP